MRARTPLLLSCVLLASAPVLASGGKEAKKANVQVKELRLPSLGTVPKAEGLVAPAATPAVEGTRQTEGIARYQVVEMAHAAGFVAGPGGPQPVGARLTSVTIAGEPPVTSRFSTLVRVRSAARAGAPIEVVVLDARGETVLRSTGTLAFGSADVTHFQVDWEPTALKQGGSHQVLVRVAGEPLGTWPLLVREAGRSP